MSNYIYISDKIKICDGFQKHMEDCLNAAEKHAVVFGQYIEDTESLIKTANRYLPDYTVVNNVNRDCVMISQKVIDIFGMPQINGENTGKELEDYCRSINRFGFSTLTAHRALYSYTNENTATASIGDNKPTASLYPFLKLIDEKYYTKKRILFECTGLPDLHCGTSEVMLSSFEAFCRMYDDKYDIYMLTNRVAAQYHRLTERYSNIFYPDTLNGMFHLGFTPNPIMHYEQQLLLNKHCLKIVQQMFDIMTMRIRGHFDMDLRGYTNLGIRISDGITFISQFSRTDFESCNPYTDKDTKLKVIYITKGETKPKGKKYKLPFDKYFLVIGSGLKHKAIAETIEAVSESKHSFIVVGTAKTGKITGNIYGYKSGYMDDDLINYLYEQSEAVVFPSMYEGFGLPVISALRNKKPLILNDNTLNRELCKRFSGYSGYFLFFSRFDEIPALADVILQQSVTTPAVFETTVAEDENLMRTWDMYAADLEDFFNGILSQNVDIKRLARRLWIFEHIEERSALNPFSDYKLISLLRFAGKEYVKHRFPKLLKRFRKARKLIKYS